MSKSISFQATVDQYQLTCDGAQVISIPKSTLKVDGKQLFDNFISKLDISRKVEFIYDDSLIIDKDEKRIVNDIKETLGNVAKKINEKFNLRDEDAEIATEDDFETKDNTSELIEDL